MTPQGRRRVAERSKFLDPAADSETPDARVDNAVAVIGDRYLDDRPLRFENEFVRHQAQSMIGDLYPRFTSGCYPIG